MRQTTLEGIDTAEDVRLAGIINARLDQHLKWLKMLDGLQKRNAETNHNLWDIQGDSSNG
jgi:hypothetical protein